jgi:type IV pilus assembly protein PilM
MLEKLTQLLNSKMSSKGDSVLGIDLGASAIKVVQLRKEKGAAVLETYGELALGPYAGLDVGRATSLPPEKLAEALKDIMREANVTTKNCGASIPFANSLISLIEMPPATGNKLAAMIPIEARKYIPVPINEVQLDWFALPEAEARYFIDGAQDSEAPLTKSLVLLVAIHNETLRRYTDALKSAGLTPTFYEIEIFSSIRASVERTTAPVAVLDIGAATSKLYIVEFGIVRSSHVIAKGSQDMTLMLANSSGIPIMKAEELKRTLGMLGAGGTDEESKSVSYAALLTLEYILTETRRVLLNFQKKHNRAVGKVIMTGGGATLKGVLDFASKQLDVDVELSNPFSHVRSPAFLGDVLKDAGPDFSVAVGLALRKLQEN